jgi:hypothetical protein
MKQPEDIYTLDFLEEAGEPAAPIVLSPPTAPTARYGFYVELPNGEEIRWCGLTKKQARDMYAYTASHRPENASMFGWEEMK